MDRKERIKELKKQRAEIDKEINRLKGLEYKEGRVSVYNHRIYIGSVDERKEWGLSINRISESSPQDTRKMGIIYCYELKKLPNYIDCLIEDLEKVKIYIESGGFDIE